jgi:pyruvate,water dikinase
VDVEWALSGDRLYVLQARPITTWVPLPPEMRTRPGEPRRLYGDAALSKGLTMNEPISPLGLDTMDVLFTTIMELLLGPLRRDEDPRDAVFLCAGGRMYANLSPLLWLSSPKAMARQSAPTDVLIASIMAGVDRKRYRSPRRPPWMGLPLLWLVPGVFWRMRRFLWNTLLLALAPERAHRAFRPRVGAFERALCEGSADGASAEAYLRTGSERLARELFDVLMPMLLVGMLPPGPVGGSKGDAPALAAKLQLGIEGNVVVEMGIELFRMARLLDRADYGDLSRLAERLGKRALSAEFLAAWDSFLSRYGWRGPLEMDLARPRYADDPRLALEQMSYMATDDASVDPEAAQRRLVDERLQACAELLRRVGPLRRGLLRRVYRLIDLFAGTRDTPKHLMLLFTAEVRRRALAEGQQLTEAGRLDGPEHVFDLRFADLRAAAEDPTLDLRQLRDERTRFNRQLAASVRWFPLVIDSRGRIPRPPPGDQTPGLLRGTAVSPGLATGAGRLHHRSRLDAALRQRRRHRPGGGGRSPARRRSGPGVRQALCGGDQPRRHAALRRRDRRGGRDHRDGPDGRAAELTRSARAPPGSSAEPTAGAPMPARRIRGHGSIGAGGLGRLRPDCSYLRGNWPARDPTLASSASALSPSSGGWSR